MYGCITFKAAQAFQVADSESHIALEDGMDIIGVIQAIGTLLGGLGLFCMGIGALYWMSIQEENKKGNKE